MWTVYYLASSSIPDVPRYVGYTCKDLSERRYKHLNRVGLTNGTRRKREPFNKKDAWVASVLDAGDDVLIFPLVSSLTSIEDACAAEVNQIARLGVTGDLVNTSAGGEIRVEFKHSSTVRNRVGTHTMTVSDEHRLRIIESNRTRGVSDETRAKMSRSQTGKKFTEEHKQKLSEAGKGHLHSEESIDRMRKSIAQRVPYNCDGCNFSTKNGGAMASHQRSNGHRGVTRGTVTG